MSSAYPGIMGSLSVLAGTAVKTLAMKFADGFLSGFCFVMFFFFFRLTGPPTQMAHGISPTKDHRREKTVSQADDIIHTFVILCVFWFMVDCRLPPCLRSVVDQGHGSSLTVTPTYIFVASLLILIFTLLSPHTTSGPACVIRPLAIGSLYLFFSPTLLPVYLFDFVIYSICEIETAM